MQLEAKKYVQDMENALALLSTFVSGKSLADYLNDPLLQSAVERQFEIIGEALGKLAKIDPGAASQITDFRRIIAFRNILIHGYAEIDDQLVWDIVETQIPVLKRDIAKLGAGQSH